MAPFTKWYVQDAENAVCGAQNALQRAIEARHELSDVRAAVRAVERAEREYGVRERQMRGFDNEEQIRKTQEDYVDHAMQTLRNVCAMDPWDASNIINACNHMVRVMQQYHHMLRMIDTWRQTTLKE